ncbi:MAG: phosphatase PAP2 family protein [Bacteroidales bacterium]|nr:phosphatase PAP2 family protein [Bacteroidales bacterium]
MDKKRFLPIAAILVLGLLISPLVTSAQSSSRSSEKTTYMTEEDLPDAKEYLPSPNKPNDSLFVGDLAYYQWGKSVRDTERGKRAHEDANSDFSYLCSIFSPAVGVTLSYDTTPAICRLLSKTSATARAATRKAKDYYKRVRPFDEFKEPTGVPEMEASYTGSASYPSGHSTRGWSFALILCELFPDKADDILSVGYQYGESRVIVGYHYASDVQAARVSTSAVVSVIHSDKEFAKDMRKAKKEARRLTSR